MGRGRPRPGSHKTRPGPTRLSLLHYCLRVDDERRDAGEVREGSAQVCQAHSRATGTPCRAFAVSGQRAPSCGSRPRTGLRRLVRGRHLQRSSLVGSNGRAQVDARAGERRDRRAGQRRDRAPGVLAPHRGRGPSGANRRRAAAVPGFRLHASPSPWRAGKRDPVSLANDWSLHPGPESGSTGTTLRDRGPVQRGPALGRGRSDSPRAGRPHAGATGALFALPPTASGSHHIVGRHERLATLRGHSTARPRVHGATPQQELAAHLPLDAAGPGTRSRVRSGARKSSRSEPTRVVWHDGAPIICRSSRPSSSTRSRTARAESKLV